MKKAHTGFGGKKKNGDVDDHLQHSHEHKQVSRTYDKVLNILKDAWRIFLQ